MSLISIILRWGFCLRLQWHMSGGMREDRRINRRLLAYGLLLVLGSANARPAETESLRRAAAASPESLKARFLHLKQHPVVAITFDDLPAAGGLPAGDTRTAIAGRLAAELRKNHLQGCYGFLTGSDLQDDPDVQEAVRVWIGAGMNIGNHTWSHPSLNDQAAEAFERDIAWNEPVLRQYSLGRDWHWFRYPYLEEGNTVAKREDVRRWLHEHGYRIAEVTLTFQDDDWSDPYNRCAAKNNDASISWLKESYLENAAEFIRLGREEQQIAFGHEIPNVLLLHETAFTTLMLPRLLDFLRGQGFRFVPLSKVEKNRAFALDPGSIYPSDGSLTNQILNARQLQYPKFKPEPVDRLNSICR